MCWTLANSRVEWLTDERHTFHAMRLDSLHPSAVGRRLPPRSQSQNQHDHQPSTAPWPTNVSDECGEIDRQARHLCSLASAAATMGLQQLAADLYATATALEDTAAAIRDHNTDRLNSDVKVAQLMSAALVRSALVGAGLKRETDQEHRIKALCER